MISEIITICKLRLVNPATSAAGERSFSSARILRDRAASFLVGELNWTKCFLRGGGGNAWEFLFNSSKVTENAFTTIKLLIFHIFSDVSIHIIKLKYH